MTTPVLPTGFAPTHCARPFFSFAQQVGLCTLLLLIHVQSGMLRAQTPDSNGLIFRDDFTRSQLGKNWQTTEYAAWSIVNGNAYNFIDGNGGTLRTTAAYPQPSYVIETSAKGFSSGYYRSFFVTFGQANLAQTAYYTLNYTPYTGGQLTLGRVQGNEYFPTILDEVILAPQLIANQYYRFRIERYQSGLIQVYLNQGNGYEAVPLLEAIDSTYQGLGHWGWQVNTEAAAEPFFVDYVEARTPTMEKPAIPEKPNPDSLVLAVSETNGQTYPVAKLRVGVKQYTDRSYTITSLPDYLQGASFVQTANADKNNTQTAFLNALIKPGTVAFIGYDPRATVLPEWLSGWTKTGDRIGTTDPGSSYLEVYSKVLSGDEVYPNQLTLGGNLSTPAVGSNMNYLLAVITKPGATQYEAETAKVAGAKVANNNLGYSGKGFVDYIHASSDYVEWTVSVPYSGSYAPVFRYAQGRNANRTLQIQVDDQATQELSFIFTGSWLTWATQAASSIYLSAGSHTIRAVAVGTSGPNLDYLSLVPTEVAPTAARLAFDSERSLPIHLVAYPNPFQQRTVFRYALSTATLVRLTILDKTGKTVRVILHETQAAGTQEVSFEAEGLAGGMYLYRLEAGRDSQVGKLLLNR